MIFTAYADGVLDLGLVQVRCILGAAGVIDAAAKREGDGASPAGIWPLRFVYYRPDRVAPPKTALAKKALAPDQGWSDAPLDGAYNRPVRLPHDASAEILWRCDHVYDLIVVLGYNDDPVEIGAGSAIFLHLARKDHTPTQGCVALSFDDLAHLLAVARPGDALAISARSFPKGIN